MIGLIIIGIVIFLVYRYLNLPEVIAKKEAKQAEAKADFEKQERDINRMTVLEKEQLAAARGYANKPSMASLFIPVVGWFHYFNGKKSQTKIERKKLGLK